MSSSLSLKNFYKLHKVNIHVKKKTQKKISHKISLTNLKRFNRFKRF